MPTFSSGAGTWKNSGIVLLFDSTLGSDAASIDTGANGIVSGYRTLLVYLVLRGTDVAVSGTARFRINNDSGTNYDQVDAFAGGLSGTQNLNAQTGAVYGIPAASATAGYAAAVVLTIPAYTDTNFFKVARIESGYDLSTTAQVSDQGVFTWRSTAAVTQLAVASAAANLKAGSRMTIYGTS